MDIQKPRRIAIRRSGLFHRDYTMFDDADRLIGVGRKKPFVDRLTFHAAADEQRPLFEVARKPNHRTTILVTDPDGVTIATTHRGGALIRDVWNVELLDRRSVVGRARSWLVSLFDAELWWLRNSFDFTVDSQPVFSIVKRPRASYRVEITDDTLDRRVVMAMAIVVDCM